MKKRLDYIDIARGIGIILVVFGHMSFDNIYLLQLKYIIYIFHMPLFYYISGYILEVNKPLIEIVKSKIIKLYLPYLGFSYTFLLFHNILFDYGINTLPKWSRSQAVYAFFWTLLWGQEYEHLGQFWFLPCMFFGIIISNIVLKLLKKIKYCNTISILILGLIFFAAGYYINRHTNIYYMGCNIIANTFQAVFFIFIGFALREYDFNNRFFIFLLCLLISWKMGVRADMRFGNYSKLLLFPFAAISGILCVIVLSKKVEKTAIGNWLKVVGRKTLWILAFHPIIIVILSKMQLHKYIILFLDLMLGIMIPVILSFAFGIFIKLVKSSFISMWKR